MTTSATKIVNATSNNNNNSSSNNSSNHNNSNNNNSNNNICRNTNTSTSNNSNNSSNKIIDKNNNNHNNNNIECITTKNVKIINPTVAPTTSERKLNGNFIMRNNDTDIDMDLKEHREYLASEKVDEAGEFPMEIENLSMGIKMPLNMTTNSFITAALTTATTTLPITKIITTFKNNNNNNLLSTIPITTSTPLTTAAATTRAMQSDEDFNIRFVNLVRNHKCLYDKKVPEYRNRDNQEKAWSLISHETRESVIHCKERWRNLRACLSRYIKQQSSNDPQHKPYYLTEHMSFLLPFLKSTRNGVGFPVEAHQQNNNNNHNDYQNSHNHHHAHQQQTTINGVNNLSALFQISSAAAIAAQQHLPPMSVIPLNSEVDLTTTTASAGRVRVKHSLSENDDEETIDAFDPAISSTLQQQQQHEQHEREHQHFNRQTPAMEYHQQQQHLQQQQHIQLQQSISPALSDTASANSMQHFIPDVQLSEAPSDVHHAHHQDYNHNHNNLHDTSHINGGVSITPIPLQHEAKRIKLECDGTPINNGHLCHCGDNNNNNNHSNNNIINSNNLCTNPDMEFFRSILPDIVNLTAQQKRKFKIGILELIDDVVTRYPAQTLATGTPTTTTNLSSSSTDTSLVLAAAASAMSSNHMLNNNNNNNKSHRNFLIHERRK